MKRSLLALLVLFAFVAGCKKDDNNTPSADNKTLLTKTWIASKVSGNASGLAITVYTKGATTNLYDKFKNFSVSLKADGTYSSNDTEGTTTTGTWTLSSDGKTLTLTASTGSKIVYTVNSVSSTAASFKYTIDLSAQSTFVTAIVQLAAAQGVTVKTGDYLTFDVIPQ